MIIVHKVPTALVSLPFVEEENVPVNIAKSPLVLFLVDDSFHFIVNLCLVTGGEGKQDYIVSGLVIFSGGLFLYVVSQFSAALMV